MFLMMPHKRISQSREGSEPVKPRKQRSVGIAPPGDFRVRLVCFNTGFAALTGNGWPHPISSGGFMHAVVTSKIKETDPEKLLRIATRLETLAYAFRVKAHEAAPQQAPPPTRRSCFQCGLRHPHRGN